MNYSKELKKFVTSQYIYSAVRISLAIVIPSIILAYMGLLKEFFLFPLATSFVGLTDQPGPFIRRRNALMVAVITFFFTALVASFLKDYPLLIYLELIVFGLFYGMIGVYGQRLAVVGSLALVVLAIFADGHMIGDDIFKSLLIFLGGASLYVVIFMIVSKIQPYKLAAQMIGENYMELGAYLRIKSKFYLENPNYNELYLEVIAQQVKIKNLQEETRETVLKTRKIVNESTTTSRLLMLMFLNSIDLHEKLMTSESDYRTIQQSFGDSEFLQNTGNYLSYLANELENLGIALQSGSRPKPLENIKEKLNEIQSEYFELRNRRLSAQNLEHFMVLRLILQRISAITDEIVNMYAVLTQDKKLAKSLSVGLDLNKFVPNEPKPNIKLLISNFSLKSLHFRHALRVTIALLLGYFISRVDYFGIGHSYWILITIIAILRPAYATTKHRNLLRLYGTIVGAILAYGLLITVNQPTALFTVLMLSMILCFSFLKAQYFWAVLFMTIYIFLTFNFLNPGNINLIFKDRIIDTAIAAIITYIVSYFVLPVWEHTQNVDLMKKTAKSNLKYYKAVMESFLDGKRGLQDYKLKRKDAVIDLANLSDNFQRMISDPKNQQKKMEQIHQFVTTAHLITAYIASLSQYSKTADDYPEIDFQNWNRKISAELLRTGLLLEQRKLKPQTMEESHLQPHDEVENLLEQRKSEILENELTDRRDPNRITRLTELKNLQEILNLIYQVAREQRKITENYDAAVNLQS